MNQTPVKESKEWIEITKCLNIPITEDDLYNSLPVNPTESNVAELSEEYDTSQSAISNNSLPMNPTESNPMEVSKEWDEWMEISKCLKIPNTVYGLLNSLTMNPTE